MANPEADNYVPVEQDKLWELHLKLARMNERELHIGLKRLTATAAEELFQIFDIKGPCGL